MSALSIFNEIQTTSCKDMIIHEPFLIREGSGVSTKYYGINNPAKKYLYNSIGIKSKLSNDLHNLDESIWRSIIDTKYNESEFSFDDQGAVILRGDIIEFLSSDSYDNFLTIFNKFILSLKSYEDSGILTSYFNEFKVVNLVFRKEEAVVIASLDFNNGWYSVHSGIFDEETFILFPNPEIETSSFNEFIILFNIEDTITSMKLLSDFHADKLGLDLEENLSLREIFDILKSLRCQISLDEEKFVSSIPGMSTDNSNIIVSFLNSFGSTFKSLKRLSYLRKTFRTGKISSGEMLRILSQEIGSESLNINGYLLANVSKMCSTEEFDRKVIKEEINK